MKRMKQKYFLLLATREVWPGALDPSWCCKRTRAKLPENTEG